MKYYAITETVGIPIYQEIPNFDKMTSQEIFDKFDKEIKNFKCGNFSPIDPTPPFKPTMAISMSEETFKFIDSVATISSPSFGEKEYKINKVKFKIFTEEEYELRYGKYEQI